MTLHPSALPLLAASALCAGCGRPEAESAMRAAADTVAESDSAPASAALLGTWTVVGHHIPGTSAVSDADAATWHGRAVRLMPDRAAAGDRHCDQPRYASRPAATDPLLGAEYHLPPGSIPPLAHQDTVELLDVTCGGASWAAMGGRLIGIDAERALAPWDGVFFELARAMEFRGLGQEPGWQLEIRPGEVMRFTYAYGERTATTRVPTPEIDPESGARVYHAISEAGDLRVEIEPTACTDVMSGRPFENTVRVTLDGETYRGCGDYRASQ